MLKLIAILEAAMERRSKRPTIKYKELGPRGRTLYVRGPVVWCKSESGTTLSLASLYPGIHEEGLAGAAEAVQKAAKGGAETLSALTGTRWSEVVKTVGSGVFI